MNLVDYVALGFQGSLVNSGDTHQVAKRDWPNP
jgi:hypothetical protein